MITSILPKTSTNHLARSKSKDDRHIKSGVMATWDLLLAPGKVHPDQKWLLQCRYFLTGFFSLQEALMTEYSL